MLRKGQQQTPADLMTPEEEMKDPFFFDSTSSDARGEHHHWRGHQTSLLAHREA